MIALVCVLAYLAASLYGARHLYGKLRARGIDKQAAEINKRAKLYPLTYESEDPVARFNEWSRTETVVGSVLAAVFWPLALTGYAVYRFVTTNPTLSHTELAAERDAMARRIRDLEHELGIKEQP